MKIHRSRSKRNHKMSKFVKDNIAILNREYIKNRILWVILSGLIAITNLVILGVCIYIFFILINTYNKHNDNSTLLDAIGPQLFITSATLILFPLTFLITIYTSKMKADKYKDAYQSIQYISLKYTYKIDEYDTKDKDIIYKKEIQKIIDVISKKNKKELIYKNVIKDILIGGK